jgi:hypothetical protein
LTGALAQANQQLCEIVNRQCDVIGAALKGECHVVQLNVNCNVNERMNAGQMVNANAKPGLSNRPTNAVEGRAGRQGRPGAIALLRSG